MGESSRRLHSLGDHESKDICKQLCLALRNAQVYGTSHAVTATSSSALFEALISILDRFAEIEWSLVEGRILINGEPCDLQTAQDLLAQRMQTSGIDSFSIKERVTRQELLAFVEALAGGKDVADVRNAFENITLNASVYARMREDDASAAASKVPTKEGAPPASSRASAAAPGVKSFDLDMDLDDLPDSDFYQGGDRPDATTLNTIHEYLAQQKIVRKKTSDMIGKLQEQSGNAAGMQTLRAEFLAGGGTSLDWEALLDAAGVVGEQDARTSAEDRDRSVHALLRQVEALTKRCESEQVDNATLSDSLEDIRNEIDALLDHTRQNASSLIDRLDADRDTVAEIEQQARAKGIGIHLSREELLASLAEINQELVQPLTTSSALLELLSSGRIGPVDGKQQKLVDTASKSLERLENLVQYLQMISGVPRELAPDQDLLRDAYRTAESRFDA